MDQKEAVTILQRLYMSNGVSIEEASAIDFAFDALEKQIAKPINTDIKDNEEPSETCPVCGSFAAGNFCLQCGQKLDWRDI